MSEYWNRFIEKVSPEKREFYENMYNHANLLSPIPKSLKKAMVVERYQIDSIFLKAYENVYITFNDFEKRLAKFHKHFGSDANSFLVYSTGVHLIIYTNDNNKNIVSYFRVKAYKKKIYETPFFGG